MHIDKIGQKLTETYDHQVQRISDPSRPTTAKAPQRSKADEVVLSAEAMQLQRAREAAMAAPDVRQEKVAALKAQIEAGTYGVSAWQVASKMLAPDGQ